MALSQMTIVGVAARRRNFPVEPPTPLRALPGITWRAFPTLMMPVVLLGGIYSGATTPTEAAALAAAYALVISVVLYRSVSFGEFYAAMLASARTSASIGMRSEEHTSELQSLMRISSAVFCLKKKTQYNTSIHRPPT